MILGKFSSESGEHFSMCYHAFGCICLMKQVSLSLAYDNFSHINACWVFVLNEFKGLTFVNFVIKPIFDLIGLVYGIYTYVDVRDII